MIAYLAAFVLSLLGGLIGLLTLRGLSRWADPQSGESRYGSIPRDRVVTVERQDALRRAS